MNGHHSQYIKLRGQQNIDAKKQEVKEGKIHGAILTVSLISAIHTITTAVPGSIAVRLSSGSWVVLQVFLGEFDPQFLYHLFPYFLEFFGVHVQLLLLLTCSVTFASPQSRKSCKSGLFENITSSRSWEGYPARNCGIRLARIVTAGLQNFNFLLFF